ncbi:MAG: SsrA-binding protein SmpB [Clostridiales bacterium]|nr:SsrA-binding protein SmpB [Clostridiales bacterium]
MEKGIKIITENKKARHDYFVEDTFEAGIQLFGTEVKSLRQGKTNLKDSHIIIRGGEMFVIGMHISPYEKGNIFNKDPMRTRKLLMHRREIDRLFGKMKIDGYTLIPLKAYFKSGFVKIEVALCKGKKLHDKRQDQAIKDINRAIDRATKNRGE